MGDRSTPALPLDELDDEDPRDLREDYDGLVEALLTDDE
jgi:hypothetical protein